MEQFLSMLAEVSLAMAVVIAVLLALSRVLERRFVPQWRCWAWLAVALRLCLPFNLSLAQAPVVLEAPRAAVRVERQVSPEAGPARWSWNTSPAAAGAPSMERVVRTEDGPAGSGGEDAAPVVEVRRIPAGWLLAFLWGAGALLFLGDQILHCRAFRRRIRRWSRPAGTYGGIPLLECGLVGTPLLMGWLRPVVVTPTGGAEEAALLHEYTHARRRDLWFQLLLVLANAIHWFNPLVWGMRRVAERDVEMACDAQVLQGRSLEERRAYGRVLLRAVSMSAPALVTSFSGEKRALKRRLRAVMDGGPKRPGRAALAVLCTAVALAGGLVACRTAALPQTPPVQETGEPRTPLERFEPQSLSLTYTGPDGMGINWFQFDLEYAFLDAREEGQGVEVTADTLHYQLLFDRDSPLLEAVGVTPFDGQPDELGEDLRHGSVRFRTGRNTAAEEELRTAVARDPACTLRVTDGAGSERTFPMTAAYRADGSALSDGVYHMVLYSVGPSSTGDRLGPPDSLAVLEADGYDEAKGVWYFYDHSRERVAEGLALYAVPVAEDAEYVGFQTRWGRSTVHPGQGLRMATEVSSQTPPWMGLTVEMEDGRAVRIQRDEAMEKRWEDR